MTQDPRPPEERRPQRKMSDEYRCIVELLTDIHQELRIIRILLAHPPKEVPDGTLGEKIGHWVDQQDPVGMEADSRIVEVPGAEKEFWSGPTTQQPLSGLDPGDGDAPTVSGAQSEIREDKDSVSQREAAEKARRIRHGEGLDLDEPQF